MLARLFAQVPQHDLSELARVRDVMLLAGPQVLQVAPDHGRTRLLFPWLLPTADQP